MAQDGRPGANNRLNGSGSSQSSSSSSKHGIGGGVAMLVLLQEITIEKPNPGTLGILVNEFGFISLVGVLLDRCTGQLFKYN